MSDNILSSLVLEINNEVQTYVPNSLKWKDGDGEFVTFTESKGDGTVDVSFGENDENKISMVSFDLFNRTANAEKKRLWKQSDTPLAIKISHKSGFSRSFKNMKMTNDPEMPVASDGKFTCEFQGTSAS